MDEFDRRLRQDAERIDADVDRDLEKRIGAALAATERHSAEPRARAHSRRFHVASALAGVAAAAVVVAVLLPAPPEADPPFGPTPGYAGQLPNPVPLSLRHAELTDPLQQELESLKSDARKLRETLERELGVTL